MMHAELIKKIWEERVNQKIDPSLILFGELKAAFGLKNSQSFLEAASFSPISPEIYCDCLALESSLARARRNKNLSRECLLFIEKEMPHAIIFSSFIYQFEKAISNFAESEWVESVHHFLKAKKLAADPLQKATCLINLVLCSENLDLLYGPSLEELMTVLGELDSGIRKGIENQLHSLELRDKWRTAALNQQDFSNVLDQEINQSTYFLTYLDQIPYLAGAGAESRLENFVKKPGHLFNKDFRIRTLAYQWSENDLNSGRLTDHIERIYLWTWKWLDDPLKFPASFLAKSIQSFPWNELDHIDKLSLDNQSQFLLAIGWLALFDSSLEAIHTNFAKKIKFSVNHRYLMSEQNVQMALRTKQEFKTSEIEKSILKIFSGASVSNETTAEQLTTIDLSNFTLNLKAPTRVVHSKSLSLAACLLLENENVAVDQLFNKALSGLEYDPFLNSHQISNLIYKLNKVLGPALLIRQKDGLIFATGDKSSVAVKYADKRTQILKMNDLWTKLVQKLRTEFAVINENKSKHRRKKYVIMLARNAPFSRLEMQKELSLSKTCANRLLQVWLTEKQVFKKGFGKNTVYYFKNITKKVS